MLATIGFEGHQIQCIIGDLPEEREGEQLLLIDLAVDAEVSRCVETDKTSDTVDYVALATVCTAVARKGQYHLLETLAYNILSVIIRDFGVEAAKIKVRKPGAMESNAFVEMRMTR